MFGVPESLLSDRGANLLANVMMEVCALLGIEKLNTTAYHPQCNGMVERMNRTLKTMLRKHAVKFGMQWDKFLPGVLWAYRNTPHETTKEKPSFLMFGVDLRSPTEAALLPPESVEPCDVHDYREELILSLSSARELASDNMREEQKRSKERYDKKSVTKDIKVGDWTLVRFPQDESGKKRKLSKPWRGPYRVVEKRDPDVTVVPVHFPDSGRIQVHQSRVCLCPSKLPPGFYWYGGNRLSHGKIPKWLSELLSGESSSAIETTPPDREQSDEHLPVEIGSMPAEQESTHDQLELVGEQDELNSASQDKPQSPSPVRPSGRYNLRRSVKPPERLE